MKVLFVVSDANSRGGTEILAFNLLHELNKKGIDCWLLSRYIYRGNDPKVISFEENEFKRWLFLNKNPINKLSGSFFSDMYFSKLVTKYAHKLEVDWVINHTYDLTGAIPTNKTFKTIQIFNWSINGYETNLKSVVSKKKFIVRIISNVSLNNSIKRWHNALPNYTKVVVLTDAAHKEIRNVNSEIKDRQIVTIPNPLMKIEQAKHFSSLNNKSIIFVGRLSHEKGIIRLLRIWKKVNAQKPDYILKIYGEGHAKQEMDKYIKLNNIKNVKFMGFSSDLESIYLNADLCCMTSDTEGFGLVLIESMYYGVPCISFDCPISPKEIISNAGIIIPAFDEENYANRIIAYLNNDQLKKELQLASIKRASNFYLDNILKCWLYIINEE